MLVAQGESGTLEFRRSTAELERAGEALSAFLNGEGGKVLIGVGPDGRLAGQEGADITLSEIAARPKRPEFHRFPGEIGLARTIHEGAERVVETNC
ncbi:MAG: ATP-binding protein [Thermoanaerobaculia bacterium]|nr:ATP-binding protein [Thermoanaerobaculia bacterium]